ncbi:hypothetical protein CRI94_07335 [Longibacter salinarum]|uniref:Uncharacterized protein n=1 Tax=Longibacter salinarum TaxID=1850348 RepID=A0A2A8CYU7_9BACT|nr:hypothetical protein CRI94_07335 [Longibacter salinarum]
MEKSRDRLLRWRRDNLSETIYFFLAAPMLDASLLDGEKEGDVVTVHRLTDTGRALLPRATVRSARTCSLRFD